MQHALNTHMGYISYKPGTTKLDSQIAVHCLTHLVLLKVISDYSQTVAAQPVALHELIASLLI